jgi:hypothetical protein
VAMLANLIRRLRTSSKKSDTRTRFESYRALTRPPASSWRHDNGRRPMDHGPMVSTALK